MPVYTFSRGIRFLDAPQITHFEVRAAFAGIVLAETLHKYVIDVRGRNSPVLGKSQRRKDFV